MLRNFHIVLFCLICRFLLPVAAIAQQGNNWTFGLYGGLTFNTDPPSTFTSGLYRTFKITKKQYSYCAASISDCKGNLLFYTGGALTFNRFHQIMPNGKSKSLDTLSYGIGPLNTAFILPKPGDSFQYYVFGGAWNKFGGLYSFTVDMRLDSGRGDVSSSKDLLLHPKATPHITAIKQINDTDYWLLSIPYPDTLYSFPVTNAGIGKPVKSIIQFVSQWTTVGTMKSNHRGDKLIVCNTSTSTQCGAVLFDFDRKTGKASSPKKIYDLSRAGYADMAGWGLEFSANDSFLYLSTYNSSAQVNNGEFSELVQYRTYSSNPDATEKTIARFPHKIVASSVNFLRLSLQIGPDSKIYHCFAVDSSIGVINHPEKRGTACGFVPKILKMSSGTQFGWLMPSLYFPIHKVLWDAPKICTDTLRFTNTSDTTYFKNFIWDFGDGDSAVSYHTKHHYKKQGKYYVRLAAINTCMTKMWFGDSVEVKYPIKSAFKVDSIKYTCGQAKVYVRDLSVNSTTVSYTFGDSSTPDTNRTTVHIYTKPGTYTIKQGVNNGLCTDTQATSIKINLALLPKADFSLNAAGGCVPFVAKFNNLSTNAVSYTWAYEDGGNDTGLTLSHKFKDTGYYWVKLKVKNSQGCMDSISKSNAVYVSNLPAAKFTLIADTLCGQVNLDIKNKSSNFSTVYWNFGDGNTSNSMASVILHSYFNSGNVNLLLKASNGYCSDSMSQVLKLRVLPKTKANFSLSANKACVPVMVSFIDSSKNALSWQWNFGDGNKDSLKSPKHNYKDTGWFSPRLIASNPQGCSDTFVLPNGLYTTTPPKAGFTIKENPLCGKTTATISNTSAGFKTCKIDFGDGNSLNGFTGTTTHSFIKSGTYHLLLTADNGICKDTFGNNMVVVIENTPKAALSATPKAGNIPLNISFKNLITNAYSYLWKFGDNTTDTTTKPKHIYTDTGYKNLILVAMNHQGCRDSISLNSYIYASPAPISAFSFKDSSYCGRVRVFFNNLSKYSNKYIWDFGNGNVDTTSISPVYNFTKSGNYRLRLKSANNYGFDTSGAWITVKVPPAPKSGFSLNATQACSPAKFIATNKASGAISKLVWHVYNPAGMDSIVNPAFMLSKGGDFILRQIVQDSAGCKDSTETKIHTADQPKASFNISAPIKSCEKLNYTLTNNSTYLKSCIWNLGDGNFDKSIHPAHTYTKNGSYIITLKVQNEFCVDSETQILNVNIRPRVDATFQLTPMVLCFGKSIAVLPKIANADSISWQMGNGTGANNKTDFNYNYSKPGKYLIWLKAYSAEGCVDSLMQPVNVLDTFKANMLLNTTKGCSPLSVKGKALTKTKDIPLKYTWTWGDGSQSNDTTAFHSYQSKQAKKINLKLKVSNGYCADSINTSIKILAFRPDTDMVHIREINSLPSSIFLNWKGLEEASYFIERSKNKENYNFLKVVKDTFLEDINTEPQINTYTYRITALDNCGNKSTVSLPARSIVLKGKTAPEDEAWLQWNKLLRPAEKYVLSKDSQPFAAIKDTDFTDREFFSPDKYTRYYQVKATPQDTIKGYFASSNTISFNLTPRIFIPNAFSPNGDGLNDIFNISGTGLKTFHLQIYDRWGALVFESFDPKKGWDGEKVALGVYLYIIDAIDMYDKIHYFKGTLLPLK